MSFIFGSPEDLANLYIDSTRDIVGPPHPTAHYEELPEPQVRSAMTYLWLALDRAIKDEASPEAVMILQSQYREVVLYLASVSDEFKSKVVNYKIQFPGGPGLNKYYRDLVLTDGSAN